MRYALLVILSSVLALSAAERVVYETDFANLTEVAQSPLVEKEYGPPSAWTGLLTLGEEGGIRHLALQVPSTFRPNLGPHLPLRADKVYRIELLARAVGQIEGVHLDVRQRTNPFTWYGATDWPVSQEWAVQTVQIKPQQDDAKAGLYLGLRGVGSYQIRSLRVVETAGWVLPETTAAPRGELLFDGAFRLGGRGWFQSHPSWGDHEQRFYAAGRPSPWTPREGIPGADFTPPTGIFDFLSPLTGLHDLRYGRSYIVTVEGDVQDNDLALMVLYPGKPNVDIFKKLHFTTKDGTASARFDMAPPANGALSSQEPRFGLVFEHRGKTQPHITRLSFREVDLGAEAEALPPPAPAAICELVGATADPLGLVGLRGEPLVLRVRAAGLPAGPLIVELTSAGSDTPRQLRVPMTDAGDGALTGELALGDLPCGWYEALPQVAAPAQACPLRFAVVPRPDPVAKPGFLGAHFQPADPRVLVQGNLFGLRTARCFEFSWPNIEPKLDEWTFPEETLAAYVQAGIEPMVILNGSPQWASSAPNDASNWSAYPPRKDAHWRAFVQHMVAETKGRVHIWQIWNEPNDYFLKINKDSHDSLEEAYVALVKSASEVIRATDPKAVIVAGATAGLALEFHRRCIELGILDWCDVLTYHAYGECSQGGRGAIVFRPGIETLRGLMQARNQVKPIWDCESGYAIAEGADGRGGSLIMLQGLIARQAAGFARHYIYNAYPRRLVSEGNFQMVHGFGNQPLISVPLIAMFDRLLNGAHFTADLGDDAAGIHAYAFTRADGATVVAGWTSSEQARQLVPRGQYAVATALDAFGTVIPGAIDGDNLVLGREPRWFVPADLSKRLLQTTP